ncbi:unnamed protein product [Cercopithifilaria johnstoni]|uniref:Uncharacterized protein n=1 Tax=Cercopithifilaria johnstoni TaxID=2874296 RepID=A0A8J2LLV6_9BILA|nr:unnamed protein product [Cercopithifilaria johnstoni]
MICQVSSQFSLLMLLFLMVMLTKECDIEIRLKSRAEEPFQFHFSSESARYWSDRIVVTGKTVMRSNGSLSNYHVFHVKGSQCGEKNWHFFVWGLKGKSTLLSPIWKIIDHKKLKMESLPLEALKLQPFVDVIVKKNLKASIGPRFGVSLCEHC